MLGILPSCSDGIPENCSIRTFDTVLRASVRKHFLEGVWRDLPLQVGPICGETAEPLRRRQRKESPHWNFGIPASFIISFAVPDLVGQVLKNTIQQFTVYQKTIPFNGALSGALAAIPRLLGFAETLTVAEKHPQGTTLRA